MVALSSYVGISCNRQQIVKKQTIYENNDFTYMVIYKERATCIKRLSWSPYEAKKWKLHFTKFFLLVN